MTQRCTAREWDAIVKRVITSACLPRDYHVEVVRTDLSDALGYAEAIDLETGRFKIEIETDLTEEHTVDVLIHEIAHVLDWRPFTALSCDHGPTFWIHVGEVYRRYHQVT